MSDDAIAFLADASNGDARTALNALELAVLTTDRNSEGIIEIDADVISECIQKRNLKYDKNGDPVNYSEPIEPAIDEERDQFIDLLLRTEFSVEKRKELLNYFDFIKYKEQHGIQ